MATDADKKKYDRQIRIWGAHGQARLQNARVCLLNAGPTGSETLKNLVLGGIAGFVIVDEAKVEAADLGNNFLLDASSLGQHRAEHVCNLLKELDPGVEGSLVLSSPAALLEDRPGFFKQFSLVVATQVTEQVATLVDRLCRADDVKLIVARSYGLVGYLRPSLAEHQVIESKPEHPEEDLRLHAPWPALEEWAMAQDLSTMDDASHAHVPYAVILLQAVKAWREQNGGKLPGSSKEKAAFKELIKAWQRKIDGVPVQEDNFTEALENRRLFKLYSPPSIPSEVRGLLEESAASVSGQEGGHFWVMVAALKRFVENEGEGSLPLEGSIPDMTALTATYLELQRLYRDKAEQDLAALEAHVRQVEQEVGATGPVPAALIRSFAKNARNLRVVRYSSLEDEVKGGGQRSDALRSALEREDTKNDAALYLLLRAADRFHDTNDRFPGSFDSGTEEDLVQLKASLNTVAAEAGVSPGGISDDYVGEVVRFGAGELHVVAAIVGGIAAQEAIKLLTCQFLPLKGTLIYNGMSGTTLVL